MNPIETDAAWLYDQHAAQARFVTTPPPSVTTMETAYDVQQHLVALMQRDAGDVVGYKIGLTSPRMQAMCGIDEPVCGAVLATRVHASAAKVPRSAHGRLGLEFEIAMRIGRATDAWRTDHTADTIQPHVDAVCAAVELVDDRHADYAQLDVRGLVADNAWNAGVVLSNFVTSWPDLPAVEGIVRVGSEVIDRGHGRDVLGDPFVAVAWLANHLAARGERLLPGQIVMTGSLVPTRFPTADATYHFELAGIGEVSVNVRA